MFGILRIALQAYKNEIFLRFWYADFCIINFVFFDPRIFFVTFVAYIHFFRNYPIKFLAKNIIQFLWEY